MRSRKEIQDDAGHRALREPFIAVLALAPALAHLLELPNKISLSRNDYLTVQQIYRGWALLGFVVAGALLSTLALLLVSWLYLACDIAWLLVAGSYLLISAGTILSVPLYLQRPIALLAYVGALLISIYLLPQPQGLEWFLPFFYLKLLVSHLPKEEPYRPAQDR